MADVTHSHLEEFNSTQKEWETYIEHLLQQYFITNDVQDLDVSKQRAILSCETLTYRLI